MSARALVMAAAGVPAPGGIDWSKAVLYLNGLDLVDHSPVGRSITNVGGVSLSSAQHLYGATSAYFNGSSYLSSGSSSSLAFSTTDDFTIAVQLWKSGNGPEGYDGVVSTMPNTSAVGGWRLEVSGSRGFILARDGSLAISVSSVAPNTSSWNEALVSRKGGVLRAFWNGSKIHESTLNSAFPQSGLCVGADSPGRFLFAGYMQQVLVLKGQALHVADYTPSSFS